MLLDRYAVRPAAPLSLLLCPCSLFQSVLELQRELDIVFGGGGVFGYVKVAEEGPLTDA